MFNVFLVFLNYPLLSLLPDFIQTPLELIVSASGFIKDGESGMEEGH